MAKMINRNQSGVFWKKFRRGRKKIFSSPVAFHASYDPDEYSQNFDQGTGWAEPDNLSRSFSVRPGSPEGMSCCIDVIKKKMNRKAFPCV